MRASVRTRRALAWAVVGHNVATAGLAWGAAGVTGLGVALTGTGPGAISPAAPTLYTLATGAGPSLLPTGTPSALNPATFAASPESNAAGMTLGFFPTNAGAALTLRGGSMLTFQNGGDTLSSATLNYRITPWGAATGSFTSLNLPNNASNVGATGNTRWASESVGVNVLSGLSAGSYRLGVSGSVSGQTAQAVPLTVNASNGGNHWGLGFTVGTQFTFAATPPTVGGTGTWNTSGNNFTSDGSTYTAWTNTGAATKAAYFAGAGGTVTVASAVSVNALLFGANYALNNSGGSVLTLTGAIPTINTAGHAVTLNAQLGAPAGASAANPNYINKIGTGTLTLTNGGNNATVGANTTWNVSGGTLDTATGLYNSTLAFSQASLLGSATGSVVNLNGGTAQFTQSAAGGWLSTRSVMVSGVGGTISSGGFAVGAGSGGGGMAPAVTIAPGATLNLASPGSGFLEYNGGSSGITGAGNLAVHSSGTGLVRVLTTLTYTGTTTITTGSTLQLGNGATGSDGVLSATPTVTNNGSLVYNVAGTNSAGFLLTGTGSLTKTGPGVLVLGNAGNSYQGNTHLDGGTLRVTQGSMLGAAPGSPANRIFFNGGTLQFSGTVVTEVNANRGIVVNAAGGTIDVNGFNIGYGGTISGTGALRVASTTRGGSLTLSGQNSGYSGGTFIGTGARINLAPTGTPLGQPGSALTNAGTIDLGGNSVSVGALTSTAGTFGFRVGAGTINTLSATTASVSGYTGVLLTAGAGASISPGVYPLITSSGGGLSGTTVGFAGGQNQSAPAHSVFVSVSSIPYRMTLAATPGAIQMAVDAATGKPVNIMPMGASISAGYLTFGPYNGGGYRSQLYLDLANDGRFVPNFVGPITTTQAFQPTGPDLMSAIGQSRHAGVPGYRTDQVLANLNANPGTPGNAGGFWLAPGNGINPDYIPLNVGGNDFSPQGGGSFTNTSAIANLGSIVSTLATLRPAATVMVSNITYRGDNAGQTFTGVATYYNPLIPDLVHARTLAGQRVVFVDLYNAITPGNSTANLAADVVHPTQAGYNLLGDVWFQAITRGRAFWTGASGPAWNSTGPGSSTSWAQDPERTVDARLLPLSTTDIYFNGVGGTVPLGAATSVRGVNFTAGATSAVRITGSDLLTIGAGGITVQAGTGTHLIETPVALGASQTWSNVSTNPITITGGVSGAGALSIGVSASVAAALGGNAVPSTGIIALGGASSYTGGTTIHGGTLVASNPAGSATGTGPVSVTTLGTLAGTGTVGGDVTSLGTIAPSAASGVASRLTISGTLVNGGVVSLVLFSGSLADSIFAGAFDVSGGGLVVSDGGVTFADGQSWDLADWGSKSGTLSSANVSLPTLPTQFHWDTSALDTAGIVRVALVPEPTALALLAPAATLLRRSRRSTRGER